MKTRKLQKDLTNLSSDVERQKLQYELKLAEMQEKLEMATLDRDVRLPTAVSQPLKLKLY